MFVETKLACGVWRVVCGVWCLGHHFQETGHRLGLVDIPAFGQLKKEGGVFPLFYIQNPI